jgi:putative acetyltransferase
MAHYVFAPDDPARPDVVALIEIHLAFAREVTPPGHVHALDDAGLGGDDISFFTLRDAGRVVAMGALRHLDDTHAEIKSMHTVTDLRGSGLGRRMLDELLAAARAAGYDRVSLETGTMPAFEPARRLYETAGFEVCPPFGDYRPVPNSVCMTLLLGD